MSPPQVLDVFKVCRWPRRVDAARGRATSCRPQEQSMQMKVLRQFSGATVRRVVDRSCSHVPEHAHEWPVLSLFVVGAYSNLTEIGETFIAAPSAILYRAGAAHRNTVGSTGFEQIEIEFDPLWLGRGRLPDVPVSRWVGGRAGAEVRTLVRVCSLDVDEERLRAAVRQFVERASREPARAAPAWVGAVTRRLREDASVRVDHLADEVGRHPSWLGAAYKLATGEGPLQAAARFRVEQAVRMLRETALSGACIAAEAGFCDQSHMHRAFRRVLGRVPSAVRTDRRYFRQVYERAESETYSSRTAHDGFDWPSGVTAIDGRRFPSIPGSRGRDGTAGG
jgi:AraC family transcriptional regulator